MTATAQTRRVDHRPIPHSVSLGLGSGTMLQALNSSMIAVAIVGIAAHFGSAQGSSWVISALYIATAVTAPTAGRLGVLLGPRRVYLAGLLMIGVGAVVGALAPTLGWLIFARVLLGIGTASQYPNAMTIIRNIAEHTGAQTRSAIAVLTVCAQSMVALGPTIGGVLVGLFGWQSIMWVNIPMVVLTFVWVWRRVPADPPTSRDTAGAREFLRSLDPLGTALFLGLVASTMFLLLSLTESPLWSLVPLVIVLAAAFVVWEARTPTPFIDVRTVARNRALSMTLGRTLMTYTAFYCVFFGLPQWLQESRGFSASVAGLLMLPVALVGIGSTVTASRTFAVHGPRRTLLIGTVGLVAGGLLLVLVEGGASPVWVLLLVACVLGIPNGFNNMGNQNLINSVTSPSEVGTAIGIYRTIQYIGANLAAVVIELTLRQPMDDTGLHRTGLVIAVIGGLLLAGVLCSRTLRQWRQPVGADEAVSVKSGG